MNSTDINFKFNPQEDRITIDQNGNFTIYENEGCKQILENIKKFIDEEIINNKDHLVIIGRPGCGKSIGLLYSQLKLKEQKQDYFVIHVHDSKNLYPSGYNYVIGSIISCFNLYLNGDKNEEISENLYFELVETYSKSNKKKLLELKELFKKICNLNNDVKFVLFWDQIHCVAEMCKSDVTRIYDTFIGSPFFDRVVLCSSINDNSIRKYGSTKFYEHDYQYDENLTKYIIKEKLADSKFKNIKN